jgi:predicted amidohydrolase
VKRSLEHIAVAADEGSHVILFPEANLTGHDFPYLVALESEPIEEALARMQQAARDAVCGAGRRPGAGPA